MIMDTLVAYTRTQVQIPSLPATPTLKHYCAALVTPLEASNSSHNNCWVKILSRADPEVKCSCLLSIAWEVLPRQKMIGGERTPELFTQSPLRSRHSIMMHLLPLGVELLRPLPNLPTLLEFPHFFPWMSSSKGTLLA